MFYFGTPYNNSNVKVLISNIRSRQFWRRNQSPPKLLIWNIGQKFAMLSLVKLKMELFLVLNSSSNQLIIIWSPVSKMVSLIRNIISKQLLSIRKLSSWLEFRANLVSKTQAKPSWQPPPLLAKITLLDAIYFSHLYFFSYALNVPMFNKVTVNKLFLHFNLRDFKKMWRGNLEESSSENNGHSWEDARYFTPENMSQ